MPKEYRTIQEVAGPLMMVKGVEGVAFDELGEIELANGERRRCKVLEVDGSDVVVQLYENAAGINLSNSKVRFLGRSMELGVSGDMLGRVFDGLGRPIDDGPEILPEESGMVWLLLDLGGDWHSGEHFYLFEGYVAELTVVLRLLDQTAFLGWGYPDYYLVSKKLRWIIGFNHHNMVSLAGEGPCLRPFGEN